MSCAKDGWNASDEKRSGRCVLGVRRVDKKDIKRIAKVLLTMATDEGEEAFDPSYMGTAEEVVNERAAITILRIDDLVRIAPDPQDEQQG
eukprot:Skav210895  [mRNA]  locus=scaffold1060:86930:91463:- [translate_table: standard]